MPPTSAPARLDQASVDEALAGAVRGLGRVVVVERTASTSTALLERATSDPGAWPDRSVLVADHQEAGRGRAGRTWTTPPGTALTVSVLLRPPVEVGRLGWMPLMAGLAVVRAVGDVAGVTAALKWPNDVLVPTPRDNELAGWGPYRKVAGVLGDLATTPDGPVVVLGIGVNVSQSQAELPVPSASSLALASDVPVPRARLLAALLVRLVELDDRWRAARGDARAAGIAAECVAVCATLGTSVRVELPGQEMLQGTATGLGPDGSLEVTGADGRMRSVLAGDVHHVRDAR